jgi:hypothetical protein
MPHFPVTIPADGGSPTLVLHVNLIHNLYHYLGKQARLDPSARQPEIAEAAFLLACAHSPYEPQGTWGVWEEALSCAQTVQEANTSLKGAMTRTAEQVERALTQAENFFRETLWPQRASRLSAAASTIQKDLFPHFAQMARRQAEVLALSWPERIDAFLVTDGYDPRGAYSHPLTVDITHNRGSTLCETVLHEATHVADVHTLCLEQRSFRNKVIDHLSSKGLQSFEVWNVWHAIIFASSASQVRTTIDPNHTDYALLHGLYVQFGIPNLPIWWKQLATQAIDEQAFLEGIEQDLTR